MLRHSHWQTVRYAAQPRITTASRRPPLSLRGAARVAAICELAQAPTCSCCESLLQHIQICLGSTFFCDDDPSRLWRALAPAERLRITPRALAACIVLIGRERQDLYPTDVAPTRPALHLLTAPASSRVPCS